jgi:hypothetical protein
MKASQVRKLAIAVRTFPQAPILLDTVFTKRYDRPPFDVLPIWSIPSFLWLVP